MLARAKSNIGPDGGGFSYHIDQITLDGGVSASRVTWGALISGSAHDLLADAEVQDDAGNERHDAAVWLRDILALGPMTANEVKKAALASGFSWATVRRGKERAGVDSGKHGMAGGWYWRLRNAGSEGAEGAQQNVVSIFRKSERLRDPKSDPEVF